jgi:4-amino-4-deoxy-L-arabinose transferase-like glycosyltransferase
MTVAPTPHTGGSGGNPERRPASRSRFWLWVLLPILLFSLSLSINLGRVDSTTFHPDESRWINRANYLPDYLDPFGATWTDYYLTRGQPPLGSYLMGLGLLVQGRDSDTNAVWDFYFNQEWNTFTGAMSEPDDLAAGRRTNAVVGALTVAVVFFIGRTLAGNIAGTAAGLFLTFHSLHIWIASQALSDQLLILILSLTFYTALRLGEHPMRGKALLLGILLGLGGSAKLSPLLLAFPLAGYGVGLLLLARLRPLQSSKARTLGSLLIIQPVIAFTTFVISYPYLWPSPMRRSWDLFAFRATEMRNQSANWPEVAIDGPVEALSRIYTQLTWQVTTIGDRAEDILDRLGTPKDIWSPDLLIAGLGVGWLVWVILRRGITSGPALMAFLIASQFAAIVVGMRSDFYRYHLPIVLITAIMAGLGIRLIYDWMRLLVAGGTQQPAVDRSGQEVHMRHPPARETRIASGEEHHP